MTERSAPVPDFGDDAPERTLAIICSKGNLDMAYPGLVLANAALGEGVTTHLFFTFWGLDLITTSRMGRLRYTPVGNTSARLPDRDARIPQSLTVLPGVTALATRMLSRRIAELEVPPVPDLLDQIVAARGHLWACRMSTDLNRLTEADLRADVDGIVTAADFIQLTVGAQLLFV